MNSSENDEYWSETAVHKFNTFDDEDVSISSSSIIRLRVKTWLKILSGLNSLSISYILFYFEINIHLNSDHNIHLMSLIRVIFKMLVFKG